MKNVKRAQDLIGSEVYDRDGGRIGRVGNVYVDDNSRQPEWVTVRTGLFGTRESFVPLRGATSQGENGINVDVTRDKVKDAPRIEAEQGHLSDSEGRDLYTYYGLDPVSTSPQQRDVPEQQQSSPGEPATAEAGPDAQSASEGSGSSGSGSSESGSGAGTAAAGAAGAGAAAGAGTAAAASGKSTESGTSAGSGTSTDSGTSTESGTSAGSGTSTGSGTPTSSGTSTGAGTSMGSGTSTTSGTSTGSGTSMGSGTSTGTSTGTARTSGAETSTSGTGTARRRDGQVPQVLTRCEERLRITTENVEAGRVRVRKYVTTEHESVTVPITREEVRIERETVPESEQRSGGSGTSIGDAEREIVLHEERPVVNTETVAVERIRVNTEQVTEEQTVDGDVRRERFEVDDSTGRHRKQET